MELKDKIHDMLVDAGYSDTVRVSANIATLAAAHYGKEWLPIADAPKDGTIVDLWEPLPDPYIGVRWCDYEWSEGFGRWVNSDDPFSRQNVQPSHFMHLPQPPVP